MKYNDTLITLLQGMNTQKIAEFELALALSNKMIKNLGKDFFMNNKHFGNIMGALGDVYSNNKSDLYKRRCKTILGTFEEVMTKEDFNKCLENEKSIRERPKTSCNTKQPLKKNIDIKLVKSKNQHNENCDNVNNQPKAQNV